MRFAAIDLGTVTCRLLVADVQAGRIAPVAKEYAVVNLGEGVDVTHRLNSKALLRAKDALADFLSIRDSLDVPQDPIASTACVATSASRDAENSAELEAIFAELGLNVQVISGMREAELTFLGASSAFAGEDLIVVDVGGGSTEITFGAAGAAVEDGSAGVRGAFGTAAACGASATAGTFLNAHSYDIGSRRITERFLHSDPPSKSELDQARSYIREVLESTAQAQDILLAIGGCAGGVSVEGATAGDSPAEGTPVEGATAKSASAFAEPGHERPVRLVAVAGTATSVVSIRENMEAYDSSRVHGASVSAEELAEITQRLASVSLQERERIVGLDPKRAPVIVAGLVILQEVMRLYREPCFTVSESDILSGIIISEYEKASRLG